MAAAVAALTPAPAGAAVEISANPALRPAFSRGTTDYVSRCVAQRPLRLTVHASDGDRVAIGDGKPNGGDFEKSVTLGPDHAITIHVHSRAGSGAYHVRCLPPDFPEWSFTAHGRPQAQWYLIEPTGAHAFGYMAFFDTHGVPIWWWHSTGWGPWDGKLLPDGTVAFARFFNDHFGLRGKRNAYEVRRLDGSLVRLVRTPGSSTDTHDLQQLPNGDFLAITYLPRHDANLSPRGGPRRTTVVDCEIQEVTPGGRVVWRWNSKDHIPLRWTTGDDSTGWWAINGHRDPKTGERDTYDLVHINSVEPDGDGLIVSARHLDAVFRIDRRTGRIDWKLGGTHVPGKSLRVVGAPPGHAGERLFSGQHDARLLRDGSLTVYDNGSEASRPPLADRFVIDAGTRTATMVEHLADPEIEESGAIGSARKVDGGNWVVSWGGNPIVTEQRPGGAIVRRFLFPGVHWSYRAVPIEPGRLSAAELRRGMSRIVAARRSARR